MKPIAVTLVMVDEVPIVEVPHGATDEDLDTVRRWIVALRNTPKTGIDRAAIPFKWGPLYDDGSPIY